MSRYIDADALIAELKENKTELALIIPPSEFGLIDLFVGAVCKIIDYCDTADVREVVRGEWIVEGDGEQETWGVCNICNMKQCESKTLFF